MLLELEAPIKVAGKICNEKGILMDSTMICFEFSI